MHKRWCCSGSLILIFLLSSCSLPAPKGSAATRIPVREISPTPVPYAPTLIVESPSPTSLTSVPAVDNNQKSTRITEPELTSGPTVEVVKTPCNRAVAGSPIDVTISDGSGVMPAQEFSKTWRLINAGACTWTTDYAVVWFSGTRLSESEKQNFRKPVRPGEIVEISVEMVAPAEPGSYQSNWKISDDRDTMFGLGPNGDSPFWVKIEVYAPASSPTTSPEPTITATPIIYAEGNPTLKPGNWVNLNSSIAPVSEGGSLFFTRNQQNTPVLELNKGVKISFFGQWPPSQKDCGQLFLKTEPIFLNDLTDGSYYCYTTEQGLPGYVLLGIDNLQNNELNVTYRTWSVP